MKKKRVSKEVIKKKTPILELGVKWVNLIRQDTVEPWYPPLPLLDETRPQFPIHNYMSTPQIYGLIRMLCEETKGPYLEIGSYRGMSLLAAAYDSKIKCTGIDNFTGTGYRKENEIILREQIKGKENIELIKQDYEKALTDLRDNFMNHYGVVFLDGPHSYKDTLKQLKLVTPMVQPGGYLILDDFNEKGVEQASGNFFNDREQPHWVKVFEVTTPKNASPDWWNGIQIWQNTQELAEGGYVTEETRGK